MSRNRQRALLQLVREVSRRQIAPRAQHRAPDAVLPADVFALLAELDLFGLSFPVDDGGLDQPTTVVCQVLAELSQAYLAVGLGTWMHLLTTRIVADHAAASHREEVLPKLIAGEWLAAHALTQTTGGAAPGTSLVIERDGDDYVLNGTLTALAQTGQADCYVVLGRPPDQPVNGDAATMLLVPVDTVGIHSRQHDGESNVRGVTPGLLTCRDVRVSVEHRLGADGQATDIAAEAADRSHLGVAACAVGLARAALQASIVCLRSVAGPDRATDGRRRSSDTVADVAAAVEAAEALCDRAAAAQDAGRPVALLGAMARMFATHTAVVATDCAVDVHEAAGCQVAAPLERYRLEAAALRRNDHGTGAAQRTLLSAVVGNLDEDDER